MNPHPHYSDLYFMKRVDIWVVKMWIFFFQNAFIGEKYDHIIWPLFH